jgi:hypothetical protein
MNRNLEDFSATQSKEFAMDVGAEVDAPPRSVVRPPAAMHSPQTRKFFAVCGIVEPGKRTGVVVRQAIEARGNGVKRETENLDSGDRCGQGRDGEVEVWRQGRAKAEGNLQFKQLQNWKSWKVENSFEHFRRGSGHGRFGKDRN